MFYSSCINIKRGLAPLNDFLNRNRDLKVSLVASTIANHEIRDLHGFWYVTQFDLAVLTYGVFVVDLISQDYHPAPCEPAANIGM